MQRKSPQTRTSKQYHAKIRREKQDCEDDREGAANDVEGNYVILKWRTVWRFLKKLEIELPYDPAVPLLGIHTEETRSERDTCTPMFIEALFVIARTWKQPRCPSADEWIRKLWYTYTMKYYSGIKKNTFESVLMRWMKLEPIIQSEVSQKDKDQYTNAYIWNLERW